jgi:hypothetical protein
MLSRTRVLLSGVVVLALASPSAAVDTFTHALPVQQSVDRSMLSLQAVLKTMGATHEEHMMKFIWLDPYKAVTLSPASSTEGKTIEITCVTIEDPPAAQRLCHEVAQLYLKH